MVGGPGGADAVGDGVALVMSLSFAIAIVITRRSSDVSMAPATCLAQLLLVVVAMPFAHPGAITGHDLVYLVALGGFQMGLGLALFTAGARLIAAAEVALITLLEVVLGPLWVWLAFTETPDRATLVGGRAAGGAGAGDGRFAAPRAHGCHPAATLAPICTIPLVLDAVFAPVAPYRLSQSIGPPDATRRARGGVLDLAFPAGPDGAARRAGLAGP